MIICLALFALKTVGDFNRNPWFFFLRESELSKTQSCIKTGKCNKIVSKISRSWTEWFLSWKDEGDKTYLIATEVRSMLFVTNRCGAPKALLFFDQSEKSLDSGLRADDALSKCIGRPFLLVSQTKKDPSYQLLQPPACNKSSNNTEEVKLN